MPRSSRNGMGMTTSATALRPRRPPRVASLLSPALRACQSEQSLRSLWASMEDRRALDTLPRLLPSPFTYTH